MFNHLQRRFLSGSFHESDPSEAARFLRIPGFPGGGCSLCLPIRGMKLKEMIRQEDDSYEDELARVLRQTSGS
jgi:hypothetical protein